ncbi:MAG: LapA family protein [Rhodomicrobium sp.]
MTVKRFIKVFLLFVIGGIIAAYAVANRQPVRFILDPFISRDVAASIEAPLFVYLFVVLFTGILIGAAAVWISQRRWRKAARSESREAARWKREAENLKSGLQSAPGRAANSNTPPRPLRSHL